MGKEKSAETTVVNQQVTPEATAEEKRLNELEIARVEAVQPGQIEAQKSGLNLINQLLTGQRELPGFFTELGGGISPELTTELARKATSDISPFLQTQGIVDSGVNAQMQSRVAGDIRRGAAEFNIGNRLNLLNLALSGQAQVQQPLLAQSAMLGERLAGLRPVTTTGNYQTNRTSMNPFMKSFQTGMGTAFSSWFAKGK